MDVYYLDGCSACESLKTTLKAMQGNINIPVVDQVYDVKQADNGDYIHRPSTSDGPYAKLNHNISYYPHIRVKNEDGTVVPLDGATAVNYIRNGTATKITGCPFHKFADCRQSECMLWQENKVNNVWVGGCSISIIAKTMVNNQSEVKHGTVNG